MIAARRDRARLGARRARRTTGSATKPAARPARRPRAGEAAREGRLAGAADFDRLVKQATAARTAEQWEEAIALYAKAVKLKPSYVEGYWYQGTAYYTLEKFTECRDPFRTVARLAPKNGAAQAFLGLCEFGLKDYDRSLQHLLQSRILGVGDTPDLGSVARYHAAVLMTRMEQYEQALETLGEFAGEGDDNPRVIEAMGLATLRMAMLPAEAPPDRRERILMAGRASYLMATRNTAAAAAGVRGAGVALLGRAERPLRQRRVPAAGAAGPRDRGVQARARAPAGSSLVADADRLRVPEARRSAGRAAVGEAGRGRGAQRVPRAQGARPGAARERRRRRRHQASC